MAQEKCEKQIKRMSTAILYLSVFYRLTSAFRFLDLQGQSIKLY